MFMTAVSLRPIKHQTYAYTYRLSIMYRRASKSVKKIKSEMGHNSKGQEKSLLPSVGSNKMV
jgi:hypothetical protein